MVICIRCVYLLGVCDVLGEYDVVNKCDYVNVLGVHVLYPILYYSLKLDMKHTSVKGLENIKLHACCHSIWYYACVIM